MENFQTQNDTALAQWVAGNKSFNVTGCFCFEQIKLSQSHPEATASERTLEFAQMTAFSCIKGWHENFWAAKLERNYKSFTYVNYRITMDVKWQQYEYYETINYLDNKVMNLELHEIIFFLLHTL